MVKSVPIETPAPALLHDFACSEHYALFVVGPLIFDLRVSGCGCCGCVLGRPALARAPPIARELTAAIPPQHNPNTSPPFPIPPDPSKPTPATPTPTPPTHPRS